MADVGMAAKGEAHGASASWQVVYQDAMVGDHATNWPCQGNFVISLLYAVVMFEASQNSYKDCFGMSWSLLLL